MSAPKRLWHLAREKVEFEGCCRLCGQTGDLQAAHVLGREHDRKDGGRVLIVNPDRIVPLGGDFGCDCHGKYDRHEVDLLPALTLAEELQAVRDAGGLELARRRLAPTAYSDLARRSAA